MAWKKFIDTLSYSTDPTKVMSVLKRINCKRDITTSNATMQTGTGKPVTTDKAKAE